MKRLLCIFLSLLALCSCGERPAESEKINIVTTVFAPYSFSKEIVKERANVNMLLKPGVETHSFEPSPKDILLIENCDIFIYTGGENDKWVDKILKTTKRDFEIIKMLDIVNPAEEVHDDHEDIDQHVWTSPVNSIKISQEILNALIKEDVKNKEFYKENFTGYKKSLEKLDIDIRDCVNNSKRKEIIFGDRFPVGYFTREYGLNYYSAFKGCSAETEADAKAVAFLCEKIKEEEIPVVFYIEMSDRKMAKAISEATGAKPYLFHSCHNITVDEFEAGATYLSLMENNLYALKEALN